MKEDGTSLSKTFRKYNLVFKGLLMALQLDHVKWLYKQGDCYWEVSVTRGSTAETPDCICQRVATLSM